MKEENEERRSAPLTCEDAPVGEQNAQEKKSTRNTQLAIFFPSISSADQEEDRKKGKKSSSFSHPHQNHVQCTYCTLHTSTNQKGQEVEEIPPKIEADI